MSTKHTQGNWEFSQWGWDNKGIEGKSHTVSCNGVDIALIDMSNNYNEAEANAKLIAAAPDLLEALQKALKTIELFSYERNYNSKRWYDENIVPIQSAINKATI